MCPRPFRTSRGEPEKPNGVYRTLTTDASLANLAGLSQLTYLNLGQTGISDAGLVHLQGMKNLQTLSLSGTKLTKEAKEALQKALPLLCVNPWE